MMVKTTKLYPGKDLSSIKPSGKVSDGHAARPTTPDKKLTTTSAQAIPGGQKKSRNRRFHALYDRIYRPDILWWAWVEVKQNKLSLHPTKTGLVHMEQEGFDFLGFHFHKMKTKRTGKLAPMAWPSQKAMKAVRTRIKEITSRQNLRIQLREQVYKLNPLIRGWRSYYIVGNSTNKFQDLDRYVRAGIIKSAKAR